jgi:hypothetical protein
MPTEPHPVTLSQVVHKAVEACEDSTTESLDELLERFQDDDEPVAGIRDVQERLNEKIGPPELDEGDAPLTMARAVIVYLAHRRDEIDEDPVELLRLAGRAEFHGKPPAHVERWLDEQGIKL